MTDPARDSKFANFIVEDTDDRPLSVTNRTERENWQAQNADLSGKNLSYAVLIGSNFTKATLVNVTLDYAHLEQAILVDANLTLARVRHATLVDADLTRAVMRTTDLSFADLTGVTLTQTSLYQANLTGTLLGLKPFYTLSLQRDFKLTNGKYRFDLRDFGEPIGLKDYSAEFEMKTIVDMTTRETLLEIDPNREDFSKTLAEPRMVTSSIVDRKNESAFAYSTVYIEP